jgi:hypothetical protein
VGHQEPSSACYPYCLLSEVDSIVTSKSGAIFLSVLFLLYLLNYSGWIYLFIYLIFMWLCGGGYGV